MFPVIDLGPVALQAAGLLLILSTWMGLWLTGKFAANLGTNGDVIENSLLFGFLAGILAARLGFLLSNPTILQDNPLSIVSLTPSMLDVNFGILVGLLVALIVFQRKHLPLWPTLDTLSPLLILAYVGFHLANFANGNAYGLPTDLPWGVFLWNANRHPVQIYALLLTVGLLTWWLVRTRFAKQSSFYHSGILFSLTFGGLALITLVTQAFVAEKQYLLGVDQTQLLSLALLAACLFLIYKLEFVQSKLTTAYISMGTNSNPLDNLFQGSQDIAAQFKILRRSGVYQTKDVREGHENILYLNRVLLI
ncbi:MAG: prolipoprotein diacylglyceryl transferase, partial [Anaerolineaceae bacterium]|nr:prolipoprotein diacylglyceryl transferase [Anaerolineaceae bacterium]